MIKTYVGTVNKDEISQMPIEVFEGRIIVINTLGEVEKAVAYLSEFDKVGIDTETKPSFKRGQHHKISLMQISTEDTCFLFRLKYIGIPDSLYDFLINPDITKIGLSLRDDFNAIRKRRNMQPVGCIDIQKIVGDYGIEVASLQKIYAILFGKKISKNQRLSNWDADILTEAQQKYAALDAWACLRIYNHLKQA